MLRGDGADPPVKHFAVSVPLNRQDANKFLISLEEDHEEVAVGLTVKYNPLPVEVFSKMIARIPDGDSGIPRGESVHGFRNVSRREQL
jgi:hypothetical protein